GAVQSGAIGAPVPQGSPGHCAAAMQPTRMSACVGPCSVASLAHVVVSLKQSTQLWSPTQLRSSLQHAGSTHAPHAPPMSPAHPLPLPLLPVTVPGPAPLGGTPDVPWQANEPWSTSFTW